MKFIAHYVKKASKRRKKISTLPNLTAASGALIFTKRIQKLSTKPLATSRSSTETIWWRWKFLNLWQKFNSKSSTKFKSHPCKVTSKLDQPSRIWWMKGSIQRKIYWLWQSMLQKEHPSSFISICQKNFFRLDFRRTSSKGRKMDRKNKNAGKRNKFFLIISTTTQKKKKEWSTESWISATIRRELKAALQMGWLIWC